MEVQCLRRRELRVNVDVRVRRRESSGWREKGRRAGPLPRVLHRETERRLPRGGGQREALLEMLHAADRERLERTQRLGETFELCADAQKTNLVIESVLIKKEQ